MTMTIEDLRDVLNGFVEAGMGAEDFKLKLSNKDNDVCKLESASIYRNTEGFLVPFFYGWIQDA
jgi:hypothetical protein